MYKAIEEWKKDLIVEGYSKGESDGYRKGELEGYSRGEHDGYNRGRELELKNNVNTLMHNMRLSLKEALDLLNVPEVYRELFYTTH